METQISVQPSTEHGSDGVSTRFGAGTQLEVVQSNWEGMKRQGLGLQT